MLFSCSYCKVESEGFVRTVVGCLDSEELREIDVKDVLEVVPLALYERESIINLYELKKLVMRNMRSSIRFDGFKNVPLAKQSNVQKELKSAG